MEPEPRKAPLRFFEIDLLRFIAALSVVFYHYTSLGYSGSKFNPIPFPWLSHITCYGYLGVHLFFLISGYVVLLSVQGKTVRQFFLSRISRLYPAFWVACTITYLVKCIWGPTGSETHMAASLHAGLFQYAGNMTMLFGQLGITPLDGPYWSLTVEISFYFLIAVVMGFKLMRHMNWVLLIWLGYLALPGLDRQGTLFAALLLPGYGPYFVAGMLFFLLQQANGFTRARCAMLVLAYLLALRSAISEVTADSTGLHAYVSWHVVVLFITLFFVLFVLIALRKFNLSRFTWLKWPGALTYPLYLVHNDIAFITFHRIGERIDKYVLVGGTLVVMLLAAYLIHVLVEKRFGKTLAKQADNLLTKMEFLAFNKDKTLL